MSAGNIFKSPTFLVAKNPRELTKAMLRNNIKHGIEFRYFNITESKGKWYAWFYLNHQKEQEGRLNGDS